MTEPVTQAQAHDRRIGRLEGIAEQLDRRLDRIERAINATNARMDATNACIERLTRWLIGIPLASLIALGTLILSRQP